MVKPRSRGARLSIERVEDRRMLAAADIVFLVDESSSQRPAVADWLGDRLVPALEDAFVAAEIIGGQYGLVGFADFNNSSRYAHSEVVNTALPVSNANSLWGNSADFTVAAQSLVSNGETEDGWDAIEHAVAEYEPRDLHHRESLFTHSGMNTYASTAA